MDAKQTQIISTNVANWLKSKQSSLLVKPASTELLLPKFRPLDAYVVDAEFRHAVCKAQQERVVLTASFPELLVRAEGWK